MTEIGIGIKCRLCNQEFDGKKKVLFIQPSNEAVHDYCYAKLFLSIRMIGGDING